MTIDLSALLEGKLYAFLLIFCRIGTMFMSMPGIGETFVPARVRLQFACLVSFILLPFLSSHFPVMPATTIEVVEQIVTELGVGIFIGLIMRLLLSTLEVVGMLISAQIGLSNAMILNPTIASQGSITGAMLSIMGIIVIFETGLLPMLFEGMVTSYTTFKPGQPLPIGDMTEFLSHIVSESFSLALRLVAPFMILGIVFQLTAGLLVKMIPQMQIFFVMAPLQIIFGLAIFAFAFATIMELWAKGYAAMFSKLFTGGF